MSKETFKHVLFIGPSYKNRQGGISSVIKTYKENFTPFNFIPSLISENFIVNFFAFPFLVAWYTVYIFTNKNIHVIHIHGASRGSFYRKYIFFKIAKFIGKQTLYHVHGAEYHLFYEESNKVVKRLINNFILKTDCLVVVSDIWKQKLQSLFAREEIYVIHNISPNIDGSVHTKAVGEEENIKFLFLGRIGNRKGIFDLLDVFVENKERWSGKIELLIGGDGEVEKLKKIIKKNDLSASVKFVGWVSGEKKFSLIKSSHVYILPTYNEGLPISILEAISFGLPVLSTPVGGIPDVVINNENGFLFYPGDKKSMKNHIDYLIENKSTITHFSKNSIEISKHYTPDYVKNQLIGLYRKFL